MRHSLLRTLIAGALLGSIAVAMASPCGAHMAWLATDAQGHAIFWFGESPEDRTYHLPERVAAIELFSGKRKQPVTLESVDREDFIGLKSAKTLASKAELHGSVTYGLYHGMKLTYHVEHLPHSDPKGWPTEPRKNAPLQTLVELQKSGELTVTVFQNGKPVKGADVKLYCSEGHVEAEATSGSEGTVTFSKETLEPGLNAVLVGVRNEDDPGKLDGETYQSSADYLTSSFLIPLSSDAAQQDSDVPVVNRHSDITVVSTDLADLPEELTSFGAAIAGNRLFVYGGHTGAAHSYSTEEQSNRLWSLDLKASSAEWQNLGTDKRLQGLALVPWKKNVVRIGGFSALNDLGEEP